MSRKIQRLPHLKISAQIERFSLFNATVVFEPDGTTFEGRVPSLPSAQYTVCASLLVCARHVVRVDDKELKDALDKVTALFGLDTRLVGQSDSQSLHDKPMDQRSEGITDPEDIPF